MVTELREREERGHTARTLILIFLVCAAVCGVFFSMGFLVGRNERVLQSPPPSEVVTSPGVIPPTVNPPPEGAQAAPQDTSAGHAAPNAAPDTEVIPPGGGGTNPVAPAAKSPAAAAPAAPRAAAKPAASPRSSAAPAPGSVGEGITLQVAALRTKADANALVDILRGRGYPVFLVTPEYAHADDNLYRVQVGPFKTREDADKVRNKLVREGFKPFIKH